MFGLLMFIIFFKGATDPAEFSIPSFTPATSKSVEVAVEGRSKVLYCLATAR